MGKQHSKRKRKATTSKYAHQLPLIGKINPRLNKILAILRTRGKHTIRTIAQELEVSYDTIKRSIRRLRVEWGVSIDHDRRNHCLTLAEKVSEQSRQIMVPLTQAELRAARLGAKALLTCPETGLGQIALKLHEKLCAQSPDIVDGEDDDEFLSFGFTSKPIYRKGIVKKLIAAKQRRRRINMFYETHPNPPEWRIVEPYGLRHVNEVLYMVGYCDSRKKRVTFCVTRIWDLKEEPETYEIPADFNMTKFLKGAFGIVGGKKIYNIVLRFEKAFSYLISERKWAGEKKRITLPDGAFELHLRVSSFWEVQKMIMGHPGSFSVLEPVELRRAVAKAGLNIYRNNEIKGEDLLKAL